MRIVCDWSDIKCGNRAVIISIRLIWRRAGHPFLELSFSQLVILILDLSMTPSSLIILMLHLYFRESVLRAVTGIPNIFYVNLIRLKLIHHFIQIVLLRVSFHHFIKWVPLTLWIYIFLEFLVFEVQFFSLPQFLRWYDQAVLSLQEPSFKIPLKFSFDHQE